VDTAGRIPEMLRQAFRVATTGCPGPVHLQFAGNEGQIDAERAVMEPLAEAQFSRVPPFRPVPEDAAVQAALQLLLDAARPVIVAGGGAGASGAAAELLQVAEALQIPVATSLNGKDLIPASHPLAVGVVGTYSRESANRVVARADLVCFAGSDAGGMTTHGWSLPGPGAAVIQIDIEPSHLGRHYPLAVAVNGDAKVALARLAACHDGRPAKDREPWLAEVRSICAQWRAEYEGARTSQEVPTRPERICTELSALVPGDGVLVADTGHAGIWMGAFYDITAGQRYLRSCGHLGWAFPAALGAKCALPDRPVVCFTGDAGLWYHLAEIETAVRWGISSVTVVNNNRSGNQSKRGFERVYAPDVTARSRELWTFTDVDFSRVAEDVGALGIRVSKPGELGPAIEHALEAGRPAIVDVRTDAEVLAPVAAA